MRKILFLFVLLGLTSCNELVKMDLKFSMGNSHDYVDSEILGKVLKKDLQLDGFSEINAAGMVRVVFRQDSTYKVEAFGNKKNIEVYDFVVQDGELVVRQKNERAKAIEQSLAKGMVKVYSDVYPITLFVSAPLLKKVELNGASVLEMKNYVAPEKSMEIETYGTADIEMDSLVVSDLKLESSGASDVNLKGTECANNVEISLAGAGDLNVEACCNNFLYEANGAADLEASVKGNAVEIGMNGAGSVRLDVECNEVTLWGDMLQATLTGSCRKLNKDYGKLSKVDVDGLTVKETGK